MAPFVFDGDQPVRLRLGFLPHSDQSSLDFVLLLREQFDPSAINTIV